MDQMDSFIDSLTAKTINPQIFQTPAGPVPPWTGVKHQPSVKRDAFSKHVSIQRPREYVSASGLSRPSICSHYRGDECDLSRRTTEQPPSTAGLITGSPDQLSSSFQNANLKHPLSDNQLDQRVVPNLLLDPTECPSRGSEYCPGLQSLRSVSLKYLSFGKQSHPRSVHTPDHRGKLAPTSSYPPQSDTHESLCYSNTGPREVGSTSQDVPHVESAAYPKETAQGVSKDSGNLSLRHQNNEQGLVVDSARTAQCTLDLTRSYRSRLMSRKEMNCAQSNVRTSDESVSNSQVYNRVLPCTTAVTSNTVTTTHYRSNRTITDGQFLKDKTYLDSYKAVTGMSNVPRQMYSSTISDRIHSDELLSLVGTNSNSVSEIMNSDNTQIFTNLGNSHIDTNQESITKHHSAGKVGYSGTRLSQNEAIANKELKSSNYKVRLAGRDGHASTDLQTYRRDGVSEEIHCVSSTPSAHSASYQPAGTKNQQNKSMNRNTTYMEETKNRKDDEPVKNSLRQHRGSSGIVCPTAIKKGKVVPPNVTKNVVERPPHLQGPLSQMSMRQIIQNAAIAQFQKSVLSPGFGLGSCNSYIVDPLLLRPAQLQEQSVMFNRSVMHPLPQGERSSQTHTNYLSSLALHGPWSSVHSGSFDKDVSFADMVRNPAAISLPDAQLRLCRGVPDEIFLDRVNSSRSNLLLQEQLHLQRNVSDVALSCGSHSLSTTGHLSSLTPVPDIQASIHSGLVPKSVPHLTRLVNAELVRPSPILATPESQILLPGLHSENTASSLRLASRGFDSEQILMSPPYRPFSVSSFMSFDAHAEHSPQVTYNDLQMSIFGERLDPFLEQFFVDHYNEGNSTMTSAAGTKSKSGGVTAVSTVSNRTDHQHLSNTLQTSSKHNIDKKKSENNSKSQEGLEAPTKSETYSESQENLKLSNRSCESECPLSSISKGQSEFKGVHLNDVRDAHSEIPKLQNRRQACDRTDSTVINASSDVSAHVNSTARMLTINHKTMQDCNSSVPGNSEYSYNDVNKSIGVNKSCKCNSITVVNVSSVNNTPCINSLLNSDNSSDNHSQCPDGFRNDSLVKSHEPSHPSGQHHKCTQCFKSYKDSSSLKRHLRVHSGKRDHKCVVCGKSFFDSYALDSHVRVHTRERSHRCTVCGKCFSHASQLQVHKSCHTGLRPYRCVKCGKSFSKSSKLRVHLRSHSGEKPFSCEVCSKRFTVSSNLKAHMRTHTGPATHRCETCSKVFFNTDDFDSHVKTHSSFVSYNCNLCDKRFVELSKLEDHYSAHTREKCFHCSVCGKSFKKVHQMLSHQSAHKKSVCQEVFKTKEDLSRHQQKHVEKLSTSSSMESNKSAQAKCRCEICDKVFLRFSLLKEHLNTHTGQKPNKCSSCGQAFCSRGGLRKHTRKHHKENGSILKENISGIRKNICDVCGRLFKQLCHLKVHKRIHQGEKPFLCEFCGKRFRDSGIRNRHIKIHTGEKPHRCSICDKSFIDSGSLQKHLAVHTKPKQHLCKTCGKGFNFPGDLKVHERSHSGEKPYKCETCGKAFAKSSKLILHRRTHSGEKPFKCQVCDRSFSVSSNLQAHLKTHTNMTTFSCSKCSRKLRSKQSLEQHLRESHSPICMIPCPQCNKQFIDSDRLKEHMFLHNKVKPFSCSLCGKSFIRRHNLQHHQSCHSAEKSHCCGKCDFSFHELADLQKHAQTHNDSRPGCEQCQVTFPTTTALHKHFCSVHAKTGDFKCSVCSKAFRRRADFDVHSKTHTRQDLFKCNSCHRGFCGKSGLRKHTRLKHARSEHVSVDNVCDSELGVPEWPGNCRWIKI